MQNYTAFSFHINELNLYMRCLDALGLLGRDLLGDYTQGPEPFEFKAIRRQYERATREFLGLLRLIGVNNATYDAIGRPARLAPFFGARKTPADHKRYAQWIYEPKTGYCWPSAITLAFDLGVTYGSVYFHMKPRGPGKRINNLKGRHFRYLIERT